MTTFSITDPIVDPIGIVGTTAQLYENTSNIYDVAIGGQPFLLGASDKYPYQRQTATYRKQQFDNSKEIGEQAFEGWWLRSQSSFHLGAGINYLDPYLSENVQYRFNDSAGVDVWTPGQITMLPATENVFALTGSDVHMVGAIDSLDQDCVFVSEDAVLTRVAADGTDATIAYGGSGSDITSLIQDGLYYYAANATNIYRGNLTGTGATGAAYYPTNNAKVVMGYVKQRIVAGIGEKIYEITQSRGGANPDASDARYTHPDSGWTWSAIVEGPQAVYASGYRGNNSSIFKFTLSTAGVLPTLTQAVTAADFPDDEHVTALGVYLGTYMMIGTNKGIRVGIIDANGDISYGPIIFGDTSHSFSFAFEDRFAYATVTNNIDGKSGLLRIDLSQEIEPGRYAYAKDLSSGATGDCVAVAFVGDTGRAAFAVANSGVYFQHATNKVATGFLDTGYIRYATVEKKYFKLIKPRFDTPMFGTCVISTKEVDGDVNSIITIAGSTPALNTDLATNIATPQEELAFRFTFARDSSDTTKGPVFDGYQIKSLPAVNRARQLTIPLINYDFETDRYGIQNGYEGRAFIRLQDLEDLEAAGDTIVVQDFTTGEQVTGLIEQLSFERTTPADRRYSGFGGIVYVSIRTV